MLNWPLGAAGFSLEETPDLASGNWNSATNAVKIANGFNFVTNAPGAGVKFFRLRMP